MHQWFKINHYLSLVCNGARRVEYQHYSSFVYGHSDSVWTQVMLPMSYVI